MFVCEKVYHLAIAVAMVAADGIYNLNVAYRIHKSTQPFYSNRNGLAAPSLKIPTRLNNMDQWILASDSPLLRLG